jgi:hypothetical protein
MPDGDLPTEQEEATDPEVSPTFTHLDIPADIVTESERKHFEIPDKAAEHAKQVQEATKKAAMVAAAKVRAQEEEDRVALLALQVQNRGSSAVEDGDQVRLPPIGQSLTRQASVRSMRAPSRSEERLAKRGFSRSGTGMGANAAPANRSKGKVRTSMQADTGLSKSTDAMAGAMRGF